MVLLKTILVRVGETSLKLVNIRRTEASPALFQAPPDYTIVDDKDIVTTWTSGANETHISRVARAR
jgi:hypothetical protein